MTSRYMQLATPIAILAAALLVGCLGQPSSSELKEVVEREFKPMFEMQARIMKNAAALGGGKADQGPPTLKEVNKVGCKVDGESAYRCDVELVVVNGAETKSQVLPMRFVKGSTGWQVTK